MYLHYSRDGQGVWVDQTVGDDGGGGAALHAWLVLGVRVVFHP